MANCGPITVMPMIARSPCARPANSDTSGYSPWVFPGAFSGRISGSVDSLNLPGLCAAPSKGANSAATSRIGGYGAVGATLFGVAAVALTALGTPESEVLEGAAALSRGAQVASRAAPYVGTFDAMLLAGSEGTDIVVAPAFNGFRGAMYGAVVGDGFGYAVLALPVNRRTFVMNVRSLLIWGSRSLLGHVVVFGSLVFVVFVTLGLCQSYSDGTLTWDWGLHVLCSALVAGIVSGVLLWYGNTYWIIKKQRKQRKGGASTD
jgi:hypothetical protein